LRPQVAQADMDLAPGDGPREEFGTGRLAVTVPARLWKVVVVLPEPGAQPRKNTRVIALLMPNDKTVDAGWPKYRTTAGKVEKLTGYTCFRDVPPEPVRGRLPFASPSARRIRRCRPGQFPAA
jgi:hypothetical protein